MQKHRKKTHFKKIAIGAFTVGIVGIPTTAMACLYPEEPGAAQVGTRGSLPPSGDASPLNAQAQTQAQTSPEGRTDVADRRDRTWPSAGQATRTPQKPRPSIRTTKPLKPTTPKPSAPSTSTKPTAPAVPADVAAQVVSLANKERAKVGCSPLAVNAKLTTAAQNHSEDMAAHNNMSHTGSDGSDPGQRITRAGYTWRAYGENVAYGYSTPEQVMTGWMNSPGHKANILNCSFTEIGVGLAQPNFYWTQDFGTAH
ncbi:CAP domain-containing protein [Streptomyces sp. SP18CS02]|uniref:CAP domain-containing protein n=1 Tax=Streptomyces sp. SP18CS02 TaxID=3002531 RepID=UPI002E786BC3|nr:CAP domain-containing protein [Streptomyces sp. SP18CS02]MEE1752769.1 CAP domain-containing protein [Streptomyces sp. SP18CS02]